MKKILILALASTILVSCLENVNPNDVIGLRVNNEITSIPADNTSTVTLTTFISVDSDKDKRSIEFETTEGVFTKNNENTITATAEDTVELDDQQYLGVEITLKSNNSVSKDVIVTATIESYPARIHLAFTEAIPTELSLASDRFGVVNSYDSEATLSASVESNTGFPSSGFTVDFFVFDNKDRTPFTDPLFREEKLSVSSEGLASAIFSAGNLMEGDSLFTGDLLIKAIVSEVPSIADSIILNVAPNTN